METPKILNNRFIVGLAFIAVFFGAHKYFTGYYLPTTDTRDLWFYSGIFMVLFSVLFIEPYYTSPKNVITNTIPLLLVLLSVKSSFGNNSLWHISFWSLFSLFILSVGVLWLTDDDQSPTCLRNTIANFLKQTILIFGRGKFVYSLVFFIFLYLNVTSTPSDQFHRVFSGYFVSLMVIWGAILSIDPEKLNSTFSLKRKSSLDEIGEIFGIQSKRIFLVKLHKDKKGIRKFDLVKFRYSMQDSDSYSAAGIVFDMYFLDQEKWLKILQLGTIKTGKVLSEKNSVYLVSNKDEKQSLLDELNVESFVGVVVDGSSIGKIKFEYSKKRDDLEEGALLQLKTGNDEDGTLKKVYYQVISGVTAKERLEKKNETGFIEGEAIQLGVWKSSELSFQKFGWVPTINTPIFIADTSDMEVQNYSYPDYKLGVIPGTTLPSVINLDDAVSHHMALLGVTGSGKSFLARKIIQQLKSDTKIICVDFTGEWNKEMLRMGTTPILLNRDNIESFLNGTDMIGIVELPTISNTVEIIASTEKLFSKVFDFAKSKYDSGSSTKISLVLEEAHTIVPEEKFLGVNNWDSKAVVNKMGQIALQGRKYGIGLLVVAQRTANVSKTILTQCNTVICFQAFDETSFNFLGNYIGKDMVQALPNLKQHHAIVTGKAARSKIPMIVDLYKED